MSVLSGNVTPLQDTAFDVNAVRQDFPILAQDINGHPLAFLDNGASSQKPLAVVEAIDQCYLHDYANVHRGVHTLSERATRDFEQAREKVRGFINAASLEEVIFVRGTTEAVNLVAQSFARPRLQPGDEIIITEMEHHSNIVPWQIVCEQTGAQLKVVPINDLGELQLDRFQEMLSPRTRLVALTHISNVLGTINPVREIIDLAHAQNVPVLLDGAQAVPHMTVDVQTLDCDFYAFSGHKMYGPTGIGVLYGKRELLQAMPPYHGGGDMILTVSFEKSTYNTLPYKFEAGTPHIAGAIGLGAAIDYLQAIGVEAVAAYEHHLLAYATRVMSAVKGLRIIGQAPDKASIVSFVIERVHPHDIATILDQQGIAVRAGHHCAMPLMKRLGVPATTRASFALYNTEAEVDRLANAVELAKGMLT